ncbi:hypothetical protein SAY86_021267 [Trapa natans]|uniref:Uncharacterized protein n=1 Tax=Trapa natans TaxID=22666 RepID=A0AAN7RFI5_TRANT|nr:hypothetical protein SAY86_021267 [Trapa natans]
MKETAADALSKTDPAKPPAINGGDEAEQSVCGGGAAGHRTKSKRSFRAERFQRKRPATTNTTPWITNPLESRRRRRPLRHVIRHQAAVVEAGVRLGRLRQMPQGR